MTREAEGSEASDGKRGADRPASGDVPLNIAGHDEEKARRENGESPGDESEGDGVEDLITDFSVADAPDSPAAADDEVEPVELLVGLADEGEIDPWDIDIVAVTDKFLDRLDEADLRTGGRALFYASVLLRMKSDHLLEDPEPEEEAWEDPVEGFGADAPGGPGVDPFDKLEAEMDRRLERKRARGMPRTLDELVRELREHERETWWKESRTYDTSESPHGYGRGTQTLDYRAGDDFRMDDEPSVADVTGTAHDEHMDTVINETYTVLREHYDQGRSEVLFAEVEGAGGSKVMTFLGILFLAHRGQIRLQQDDLFGDLWVQDPGATGVETEAVADGGAVKDDTED
jgi:segregation and condensation protein A